MYRTVEGRAEATYEIKKSVFLAKVAGVSGIDEGVAFVKEIKKAYPDARHNCYAVLCHDGQKFSDDGEPSGTAGQPIMQVLKNKGLSDVAVVVTRYFGGIKLGANGLVTSYTKAASDACDKAKTALVKESRIGTVECDYADSRKIGELVEKFGKVLSTEYGDGTKIIFAVPQENVDPLSLSMAEATAGKTQATYGPVENVKYNEE